MAPTLAVLGLFSFAATSDSAETKLKKTLIRIEGDRLSKTISRNPISFSKLSFQCVTAVVNFREKEIPATKIQLFVEISRNFENATNDSMYLTAQEEITKVQDF